MDNQFNPQPSNPQPPRPNPPTEPEPNLNPNPNPGQNINPTAPVQPSRSSGPNLNFKAPSVSLGGGSFNMNSSSPNEKKGGKKKKVLIILLTVVILAAIGAAGYFFVLKDNSEPAQTNNTPQVQVEEKPKQIKPDEDADDATADWQSLASKEGAYSFKHPKTWTLATNPETCNPGFTLIAADTKFVGKCGSEDFGQMSISSEAGNTMAAILLTKTNYSDLKSEEVTIGDIKGVKQTGSYSGPAEDIAPPKGQKIVKYVFFTSNKTYAATYNVLEDAPDALNDFNLMVTKTFKFSAE